METGSVGSMTSYLASPYMALCLLVVLGLYPFVCKGSVVCVDCSGPGCEHPGSCETNSKCFLRRDVNGLLYRGCADNQRWEGLDLGYNGCRWQHYLGWDNARVLWCLCHKPNCNNVTVGVFMLRDYSVHVQRPTNNNEQSSRDHQRVNGTVYHKNHTHTHSYGGTLHHSNHTHTHTHTHAHSHAHIGEEWSTDSVSHNGYDKQQGKKGEFESESTQTGVDESGDRGCNISRIICKILGRDHTKDNAGSSSGGSLASSTVEPIASNKDNDKDSGSEEAQNRDPSPSPLDIASDPLTVGDESSDEGLSDDPDIINDSQDGIRYEHASTTESTMHGTIPVTEDGLSLGGQRKGRRNQTSQDSGTTSQGNSDSGEGNAYEARYDMDLDYEADYAARMEENGEGNENRELGSPQDGGAKTNNKDYRWLVNTDGTEPYEPIGPIDGLDDLNSPLGEPMLEGTASSEEKSPSGEPQTGIGATEQTSDIREPLPDGLQTGGTGGDKWWDEGIRDSPVPLDRHSGDRVGPVPLNSQERVREEPQSLNNQDGVRDGPVPLDSQGGVREGTVPVDSQVPTVTSTSSDAMLSSSTSHPQQIHAKCPSDFKVVPHLHSCYHVDRAPQTWQGAADHCTRLDPRAHLVTVDRPGEYQYIVLKVAMEPKLMRGWQGWWTSGRYDANIREFTWANTGHVISRLDPKWRHGLIVAPYSGTCVWFVPLAGFKIGNYGCLQPAGAICEIDL